MKHKNSDIKIIKNIEEITLNTFENELIQVFINILNNAKDALESCEEKLLFIDAYENKDKIVIEIKDNAGGIQKENIQRVFEPYFTTKYKSNGTGIGLYMTHQIIQDHMEGKIEAENTTFEYNTHKYKGAIFTIKLPLS